MALKPMLVKKGVKAVKVVIGNKKVREAAGKIAQEAGPVIKGVLDHRKQNNKDLIRIPDVVELQVEEARSYLEQVGLVPHKVLAQPKKKYQDLTANTVVAMAPKAGYVERGTLIKLYYVTEAVVQDSRTMVELPSVLNKPLEKASSLLLAAGLMPEEELLQAHRKYADKKAGYVLAMKPAPSVVSKHVKKGSTVVLKYLDEEGLAQSRREMQSFRDKISKHSDRAIDALETIKKIVPSKRKER